jgi:hypothetical protein
MHGDRSLDRCEASLETRRGSRLIPLKDRGDMPDYRAYIIGLDGHFFSALDLECADDTDATEQAKLLAHNHDVELWHRDRKVASFEQHENSGHLVTYEIQDGRTISKPAL